jgi:O-antigen/teichoic acid export membrane protein
VVRVTTLLEQATPADTMTRSGYALVASTLASGAIGVVYWVLAARVTTARQIGADAATLTAVMLIASVAGLNLSSAFVYLLPRGELSPRHLVLTAYRTTASLAFALGCGVGLALHRSLVASLGLAAACSVWVVFTAQDGVLTGLRHASWVLTENVAYGFAKLAALALLAWWGWEHAVLASWVLPAAVAVPVVNVLVFRRLIPRRPLRNEADAGRKSLRGFLGLNYGSALVYQGYVNLLPIVVAIALGNRANGLFYIAWTWTSALDLVSHAMGAALTVELSAAPHLSAQLTRRAAARLSVLVLAGVGFLVALAPYLLAVYGEEYRASTSVLRLLALGAVPRAVVIIAQATARARGMGALLLWSEGVICAVTLGLTLLLIHGHGTTAVAAAWVTGNAAAAIAVAPALVRATRPGSPSAVSA